jgi:hypothetical protein
MKEFVLHDAKNSRDIPVLIYLPDRIEEKLSVVLFAPGYQKQADLIKERTKFAYKQYEYLANYFTSKNYVFVSMQHDLPNDRDGIEFIDQNLPQNIARTALWHRCNESLLFVIEHLKENFPLWDYSKFMMVGHSNGADIAKYFSNRCPELVSHLILLDGRRCPLKANLPLKTLMFEADDTMPDHGMIPEVGSEENQNRQGMEWIIVKPKNAKHNAYNGAIIDDELKNKIIKTIDWFLLNW